MQDPTALLMCAGNDKQLALELIQIFQADVDPLLHRLKDAAESGDYPQLERSAHTLKGCLGIFGADAATKTALALEHIARNPGGEDPISLYRLLEREIQTLMVQLNELKSVISQT